MSTRRILVGVLVGAVLLIGAAPALAQSDAPGPVSGWAAGVCGGFGTVAEKVGDLLGMSGEEIAAERQDGKSLAEIADEQGVGQDELIAAMLEGRQEALQQAVDAGEITQEQADFMIERMQERMQQRTSDEGFGPRGGGFGGCGGPGAGGGFGGGPGAGGCFGGGAVPGTTSL